MFDFPNNPTVGQGISAPNGVLFVWDGVKWEQGAVPQLYVPMAGGSMTGPLILSQDPVVILGAATKRYVDNAIGAEHGNVVTSFNTRKGDITLINTDVANAGGLLRAGGTMTGPITLPSDPSAPLQAATMQYVDAVRTYVNGTFYPASTTDARYTYKTGDTMSGALTVPYLHSTGSIAADTDLSAGSRLYSNDSMNYAGTFYVAGNYAYYMQRNGSNGNWYWVEGGNITMRLDTAGNLWPTAALTATWVHSTGGMQADSNISISGGVHYSSFYAYTIELGWDGQNIPCSVDNGGAVITLVSSGWVSGNFYGYNSSPSFWDCTVGGTLYAQNGNANHQFSNISVGGNAICSYVKSNGWVDGMAGIHSYGQLVSDGEIHCSQAAFSVWVVTTGVGGDIWGFWQSSNHVYIRCAGQYDCWAGDFSDERRKQDIAPSQVDCLALVRKIPLHEFRYREMGSDKVMRDASPDAKLMPIGFIAQQVAEVFPTGVVGSDVTPPPAVDGSPVDLMLNIHTNSMMAALVGAVQQLADRLDKAGVA